MKNKSKISLVSSTKNFNLLVLGQIITVLGSSLLRFALSLYVLDTTGSETIFATLFAISSVPMLLAPVGGAISDRFNRQFLMVLYDFTCCFLTLCLFFVMLTGHGSVFVIGVVMVLLGIIGAIETPNGTACIPLLVPENKLEGANGIVQAVQALSSIAAPILGGILYGAVGVQTVVIFSSISFFLSAVMEIFIKIPFEKRILTERIIPTILKDMKEGFTFVVKQKFILKVGLIAVLLNLFLSPYFLVGAPIVLRVTMQSGDTLYGIGMGLINFATILGALSIGFFAKKMKLKKIYLWILVSALMMIPMALSLMPLILGLGYYPSFIMFMLGAVPIAASMTIISIYIITKVQKVTPNENLGKVMAIMMAVAQCAAPLGQIMYGVIFKIWSTQVFIPTFIVSVVVLLLAVLTQGLLKNEEESAL